MNFLEELVATPLARAVGWTLLHSLWEGAAISLVLAAVLSGIRSARARYTAACVAMLASIAAFSFTFVRLIPDGMYGLRGTESLLLAPWNVQPGLGAGGSSSRVAAMVPWLAPVWMIGVWVFVLAQVAGWFSVSRLRIRGVCSAPELWQTDLTRLRTRLRISRPVQLLESSLADFPVVIGHLRPVILMPLGLLSGTPAGQVEAILLHELAHVRRCDYLVNVVQRLVESLFFYNPAIWWISHVIRTERENCCDDVVVATSINPREYASALAALERNRSLNNEAAVAASGGNLMKRIRRLLYPSPAPALWAPTLAAAILVVAATVALAAWPSKVLHRTAEFAQARQKTAHQSQYQKWLNEDVVYIITPKERAAFDKLKTDAERDKFVQQFWERRNPHPGSAVNAFKQQHYHRLAYANQHFAAGTEPGWRTDRGHVLIVYGPPDEIDSHPAGKQAGYEEWRYRHIEDKGDNVTFRFVDRSGKGDYKLVSDPVIQTQKHSAESLPKAGTDGYSEPECIYCPQPQYTEAARKAKYNGSLELLAVVAADGRPVGIQVLKSVGFGLDRSAIETVRKWRFHPAVDPNGKPAAVRQDIEIGFHMY